MAECNRCGFVYDQRFSKECARCALKKLNDPTQLDALKLVALSDANECVSLAMNSLREMLSGPIFTLAISFGQIDLDIVSYVNNCNWAATHIAQNAADIAALLKELTGKEMCASDGTTWPQTIKLLNERSSYFAEVAREIAKRKQEILS